LVFIKGHRPFPLYESLLPIGILDIQKEKEDLIKQLDKLLAGKDELEKIYVKSNFFQSKKHAIAFKDFLEVAVEIMDLFSDTGINEATFKITESWEEMTGDLLDRWFEVIDFSEETGIEEHYSFSLLRFSDIPKKLQELLSKGILLSKDKLLSTYQYSSNPRFSFAALIQPLPLNLDKEVDLEKNSFDFIAKDENILTELDEHIHYLMLDERIFELIREIDQLKNLEEITILSIIRFLKIKLKMEKEKKDISGMLKKEINFKVKRNNFPFFFDVEIIK